MSVVRSDLVAPNLQPIRRNNEFARNIEFKRNAMEFLARFVRVSGMVFYSVDRSMNADMHVFDRVCPEENGRYTRHFHELDPFHPRRFAESGADLASSIDGRARCQEAGPQQIDSVIHPTWIWGTMSGLDTKSCGFL